MSERKKSIAQKHTEKATTTKKTATSERSESLCYVALKYFNYMTHMCALMMLILMMIWQCSHKNDNKRAMHTHITDLKKTPNKYFCRSCWLLRCECAKTRPRAKHAVFSRFFVVVFFFIYRYSAGSCFRYERVRSFAELGFWRRFLITHAIHTS